MTKKEETDYSGGHIALWDMAGRNQNMPRFRESGKSYRGQESHQARSGKDAGLTLPVSVSAMWVRLSYCGLIFTKCGPKRHGLKYSGPKMAMILSAVG